MRIRNRHTASVANGDQPLAPRHARGNGIVAFHAVERPSAAASAGEPVREAA